MKTTGINRCSNCLFSKSTIINNDYICTKQGVVSADYSCRKFVFDPKPKNKCSNCMFFSSCSKAADNIGFCTLFSRRTFNGNEKKSCRLFTEKDTLYTKSTG